MPTYSDKQLEQATQVAYADLGPAYEELVRTIGRTSFSLKELKEAALDMNENTYVSPLDSLTDEQLNTWSISGAMDMMLDVAFRFNRTTSKNVSQKMKFFKW